MNHKELIKGFRMTGNYNFSEFSQERYDEFSKNREDAKKELESLGDNLTKDDYERVKKLYIKLETNTGKMLCIGINKNKRSPQEIFDGMKSGR